MTSAVFLAILCLRMVSSSPPPYPVLDAEWQKWKTKYGKSYSLVGNFGAVQKEPRELADGGYGHNRGHRNCIFLKNYINSGELSVVRISVPRHKEEAQKRVVWEENMKKIQLHNGENGLGKHGFTMEMNAFGDMTIEEFRKLMIEIPITNVKKEKNIQKRQAVKVPKFLNWRKRGYVTPVRRQGRCNACWAFSVTGVIEGQMFRKTGQLIPLSVQNLVDCSRPQGNLGCYIGNTYLALQYVKENGGLESEATYPYEEKEGACRYHPDNSTASITGFEFVPKNEDALMNAVATLGPISVAIDARHESFRFYRNGIYHEPNCSSSIVTHAMLLVGYGFVGQESDGRKYWIVKNSMGKKWGNRGYMKIAKDQGNHCGIATYALYPRV